MSAQVVFMKLLTSAFFFLLTLSAFNPVYSQIHENSDFVHHVYLGAMPEYDSAIHHNTSKGNSNVPDRRIDIEKFITIGGVDQWVTIKGENKTKPIVLFLHGGPGSPLSPFSDTIYGEWEKDFVLVQWDQRGTGRTFGRNAPAGLTEEYLNSNQLTLEQLTTDGIELSQYLINSLGQRKIILLGTSWGSVLGVHMAMQSPELYHAYIGHSQVVQPSEALEASFDTVLRMAGNSKDQDSLNMLETLGTPPYDHPRIYGQLLRIIRNQEANKTVPAPESWWNESTDYNNEKDRQDRLEGNDYSFIHYTGFPDMGIEGMQSHIDLTKVGTAFQIPVFLIQGEEDILTPNEITKAYFEKIRAPEKGFFMVPEAGHDFNTAVIETQYEVIKNHVLPRINDW